MSTSWKCREEPEGPQLESLVQEMDIPELLARLLWHRGIHSPSAARSFLTPAIDDLHSPFELYDMDRAVDRIVKAMDQEEKIGIFGDFDVDGVTSTSLLHRFFEKIGSPVNSKLPNRLGGGYGLSKAAIDEFHEEGVTLLITVDCGITAIEEVAHATEVGIDCIITDHHQPKSEIPAAHAVINPRRTECTYPFKDLAGVGLAWKLADAVAEKIGEDRRILLEDLDLVAVGSIADVAPVRGENRVLVHHGIEQLARTGKSGFRHLLDVTGLTGRPLGYGSIAFGLAPRINAAGRMGDAWPAFELLTTHSDDLARRRANELDRTNKERQALDLRIFKEALSELQGQEEPPGVVLASDDWHAGVIGIVASRIKERYHCPAILIALNDGVGRGSARSVPGFRLHEMLDRCSDLLIQAGGHALAAGLVIKEENISAFRDRFQELYLEARPNLEPVGRITVDAEVSLRECDWSLLSLIDRMSPFGSGNEKPVLLAAEVSAPTGFRRVGRNHVKFLASQGGVALDAIAFQVGHDKAAEWGRHPRLDLAFTLEENRWGEESRLQLNIKGVRPARVTV